MSDATATGAPPRARWDRPGPDEYAPYYAGYITKVPEGDLLALLEAQVAEVRDLLGGLTPAQAGHAYAPGKWMVKEVLGHLTDTERVFSHRALSIARGDPVALPSWEHETWIAPARFGERPMASLLAEWTAVRRATLALLAGLPADTPTRRGTASGNPFSVRALAYVPPGHTIWHLEVLRARYL